MNPRDEAEHEPILIELPETLHSERLVLAMPRAGDGVALNRAVLESLRELQPWMPWAQSPPSVARSEADARRMHARFVLREDLAYFLFERLPDGRRGALLGGTGLHRMDWSLRRFEIGYWVRSSAQRQGLASEAVKAMTRLAFTQLRARRVEIRMDELNQASQAVARRCGFALEGVLRQESLGVNGSARDTCVYALTTLSGLRG